MRTTFAISVAVLVALGSLGYGGATHECVPTTTTSFACLIAASSATAASSDPEILDGEMDITINSNLFVRAPHPAGDIHSVDISSDAEDIIFVYQLEDIDFDLGPEPSRRLLWVNFQSVLPGRWLIARSEAVPGEPWKASVQCRNSDGDILCSEMLEPPLVNTETNTLEIRVPRRLAGDGALLPSAYSQMDFAVGCGCPDFGIGDRAPNEGTGRSYSTA